MNARHGGHSTTATLPSAELLDSLEMRLLLEGRLAPNLTGTYRDRAELVAVLGPDRLGYVTSTASDPGRTAR